ncbi:MAG: AlpA family phage regulatory protein, partial [Candidatus Vecturithrix sp.]|nr:AlpA family phage regulatory protein [Candidatus Vecturithrix sp.]
KEKPRCKMSRYFCYGFKAGRCTNILIIDDISRDTPGFFVAIMSLDCPLRDKSTLPKNNKGGQHMSKDSKIPETEELPKTGLLRIKQVLRFVPVSRSNWWAGVKSGRYPKPLKLSERVTVWRAADIRQLVEAGSYKET